MPELFIPFRRGRLLRLGAAATVLLALACYVVTQYLSGSAALPHCEVVSTDKGRASYEFDADQTINAATISAVGTSRGMPERAVTIALATALQESGLRNLPHGDRDSLGLFQQRPSQGWGTTGQIMDPVYAAGRFYDLLAKIPGYSRLPLTVAAQRVQHSGFPKAYAKHEPDAAALSAALTGRAAASLSCQGGEGAAGDPGTVRAALVRDFGQGVLPGTWTGAAGTRVPGRPQTPPVEPAPHGSPAVARAPGTPSAAGGTEVEGAAPASAPAGTPEASDTGPGARPTGGVPRAKALRPGRVVVVPVREARLTGGDGATRRGWEVAQWAVAHSSTLGIERVSYAGRSWNADGFGEGWRKTGGPASGHARPSPSEPPDGPADGTADDGHRRPAPEAAREPSDHADVRIVTVQ
ncbi:hypothetical protein [Streptomyces tsukubensis]|uniref:hypothetical protein n=1 Tax=Streptomyces tsukubensis TaxID=83656 RepID=UPI001D050E26|nr:hypothetical protein [Streptomyces tsukubensis]